MVIIRFLDGSISRQPSYHDRSTLFTRASTLGATASNGTITNQFYRFSGLGLGASQSSVQFSSTVTASTSSLRRCSSSGFRI